MKKREFDNMVLNRRGEKVFLEGNFIGTREYYNHRLVLYDMGEFFAEVWYRPDENEIHKIISISQDDKRVDLYIKSNT